MSFMRQHIFPVFASCHVDHKQHWDTISDERKAELVRSQCFSVSGNGVPQACFCIRHFATQTNIKNAETISGLSGA